MYSYDKNMVIKTFWFQNTKNYVLLAKILLKAFLMHKASRCLILSMEWSPEWDNCDKNIAITHPRNSNFL